MRKQAVESMIGKRFDLLAQDQALISRLMDPAVPASEREQVFLQKAQLKQQWEVLTSALKVARTNWEKANEGLQVASGY